MKRFFQDLKKGTYHEIEIDTDNFEIKTKYGEFKYYFSSYRSGKESSKKYKTLETTQKNFDKKCNEWLKKGYEEASIDYPLGTRKAILENAETQSPKLIVKIYDESNFDDIIKLKHLTYLSISGQVREIAIPPSITELENLTEVRFRGMIKSLPDNFGDLKNITKLEFDVSHPFDIPDCICNCPNLEYLEADSKHAFHLPNQLPKLKKLKQIRSTYTYKGLQKLPDNFGDCQSLEFLNFSNSTDFGKLPESFGKLKNLKRLTMEDCKLKEFPLPITKLKNLEELNLSENTGITELPDEIGNMKSLKSLNLSGDTFEPGSLKTLPDGFFKLTNLEDLNLENNKIKEVQKGFKKLKKLKTVNFQDNPISNMPRDLAYQGRDAIFMHFGWIKVNKNLSVAHNLTQDYIDEIIAPRKELLDRFQKLGTAHYYQNETDGVYNLLTFKSDQIPKIKYGYSFRQGEPLGMIPQFFLPLDQWNEIDHRIMVLLAYDWGTVENITERVSGRRRDHDRWGYAFYKWYTWQIDKGIEPDYEDIEKVLKKYEKDDTLFDACLTHLNGHLVRDDKPTKFGEVLRKSFRDKPTELVKKLRQNNKADLFDIAIAISNFLIEYEPKTFAKHAEAWLFDQKLIDLATKEDNYFKIHIPSLIATQKTNPKEYESFLTKAIDLNIRGYLKTCIAIELHRVNPKKHKNLILQTLKDNLSVLLDSWTENEIPIPGVEKASNTDYFNWLIKNFKKELKEDILAQVLEKSDEEYEDKTQKYIPYLDTLLKTWDKDAYPIVESLLVNKCELAQVMPILQKHDYESLHEKLWTIFDTSRDEDQKLAVAEIVRVYSEKEILKKIPELISSKKISYRNAALKLLVALKDNKTAKKHLQEIWKSEANLELREMIVGHLEKEDSKFLDKNFLAGYELAVTNDKLKKKTKKWLDGVKLPDLYWTNGKKIDPQIPHYLFYLQKDRAKLWTEPSNEANLILNKIDKSKSGDFAKKICNLTLKNDGLKVASKPVAAIFSSLGDERIITPIKKYCTDRNNVVAPALLGNMGSEAAARALDAIKLYYKTKYPNVNNAASEAFDKIAETMGIDRFQLMDRMVPDFGFVDLFKEVDVVGEKWKGFINPDLKLNYLNEDGDIKKKLPTKTDKAVKDEIKELNKFIRSIAKIQKQSLEFNLISQRRWKADDWKKHFMGKALTFAFAQSLIWGIYKKGKLVDTFGVNQDQTLENADYDEITLPKGTEIGMVHPLELTEDLIAKWKTYLADNAITQCFEQLDRMVFVPEGKSKLKTIIERYKDKKVSDYRFRSLMGKRGWKRGSVVDGGMISNYKKSFNTFGIEVFVELEEMYVYLGEYSEEIELREVYFVGAGSVQTGSYVYDSYRDENDSRLFSPKDLPPIVYSETIYDFHLLLGE